MTVHHVSQQQFREDPDPNERFDVWQIFADRTHEKVRERVEAMEAVEAAMHYATSVGAKAGTTVEVLIVDSGDMTNWHWKREEGVVFPRDEHMGKLKLGVRE